MLTSAALYLLEVKEKKVKQKHRFPLKEVQGLHVSPNTDNLVLIQIPVENAKKDKVRNPLSSMLYFDDEYLSFWVKDHRCGFVIQYCTLYFGKIQWSSL